MKCNFFGRFKIKLYLCIMNKEFVTYEQALALKELGFDEPCFGYYNGQNLQLNCGVLLNELDLNADNINAPLYQQAFRWFREKYDLSSWISGRTTMGFSYTIDASVGNFVYNTHEEAEQACLNNLIKIIKDGK